MIYTSVTPDFCNLDYRISLLNKSTASNHIYQQTSTQSNTRNMQNNMNARDSNSADMTHINSSNTSYIAKRDFLFRFINPNTRTQIKMDDESLYSTTDQLTADRISKDILKFVPNTSIITDATACIGGTAYSFSQFFSKVNAIEIDSSRYTLLVNNISVLLKETGKDNISFYNDDSINVCRQLKQHVIFIDPPWGGPDYKKQAKLSLYLSNIELSSVCKQLHSYTEYIVLKVPTNFDENRFIANTQHFLTLVHKNTSLRKMYLLIFRCNISIYHLQPTQITPR